MSCNSCPCVCVLCLGGPEELRFSAWMAVQERRTATAAENGLRDRCWGHPHAQAQLPAQVNHANMTFTSIYISKMHIHYISISFLIGLTLLNLYANITQACLEQHMASIRMRPLQLHVFFVQPFCLLHWLVSFFQKRPRRCESQHCTFILPFQSAGGRLSYLGCLACWACLYPRMLRICWKVSDCIAPLDYGVLAVHRRWNMMILQFECKRIPPNGAQGVGGGYLAFNSKGAMEIPCCCCGYHENSWAPRFLVFKFDLQQNTVWHSHYGHLHELV